MSIAPIAPPRRSGPAPSIVGRKGRRSSRWRSVVRSPASILALALALGGCAHAPLLDPQGPIGSQEKHLILLALGIMLAVVIPVIVLTLAFAWRYRASNTAATYAPKWAHSSGIEFIVWTIPCLIVLFLAVQIWTTTHALDPYKPLASAKRPIRVQVVALNWKWLFIYPDYGIATVNQLPMPVGTPIDFKLTADSMMNSFFIPALGSQVYAMGGMETQLHLIASKPGRYAGLSSAFSGPGFSDMHFKAIATDRAAFDAWVRHAQASPLTLDKARYALLARPSSSNPVTLYAHVAPTLFGDIVNQYMPAQPGGAPAMAPMAMADRPAEAPRHVLIAE